MIKYLYSDKDGEELEILDSRQNGCWIYAKNLNPEEIDFLEDELDVEGGHLQDALDQYEVPRLEIEDSGVYVFSRVPMKEQGQITTTPFLVILGKQFILTSSEVAIPSIDKFVGKPSIKTTQKLDLFILIIKEVNAVYYKHMTEISRKVRKIRVSIERISSKEIIQFVDYEQVLNDFISALIPMSANLKTILTQKVVKLEEESEESIEDLLLSSEQLLETAKATLKTIVNIREAYSVIMSHDLNRVMKILTAMTIIVTVPTMISSFYGMNIQLPFMHSPLAFTMIVFLAGLSVIFLVLIFKRNRWL
jgi:magnesium transporter